MKVVAKAVALGLLDCLFLITLPVSLPLAIFVSLAWCVWRDRKDAVETERVWGYLAGARYGP